MRMKPIDRAGYLVGALLMLSGLAHFAILAATSGSWEGPLSLRKPMTFGFSFGLTLITIVWVTSFVKLRERTRALAIGAFTLACALETTLVSLQAWRGVPSHFNVETRFDARIAGSLAAGGAVLVIVILALAVASFRVRSDVALSMRVAIRIAFVALLSAQIIGALMIAKGMRLVFAGDPQAAYAAGGTLKPAHAVAMHGMQLLPALAWLLSYRDWPERRRLAIVIAAAAGYLLLAALVVRVSLG